jgi:hypothetical protein
MYGKDTLTLRDRFAIFERDKTELKDNLEDYITNPAHSLELRWQMFLDAPDDLSTEDSSIYEGLDRILGKDLFDELYRPDNRQRGEVIYLLDCIHNLQHKKPELVDKVKEQILKDNIKSFIYDW